MILSVSNWINDYSRPNAIANSMKCSNKWGNKMMIMMARLDKKRFSVEKHSLICYNTKLIVSCNRLCAENSKMPTYFLLFFSVFQDDDDSYDKALVFLCG